jgi:hypothetical protein
MAFAHSESSFLLSFFSHLAVQNPDLSFWPPNAHKSVLTEGRPLLLPIMDSHLETHKRAAVAEQRSSSQSSRSQFQKSSKSPGPGFSPQNLPPIHASNSKTPPKAPIHLSRIHTDFEQHEKDYEDTEVEEEPLGGEDGQEEALQALASYGAFQLTLLRHFAENPIFPDFLGQKQASATIFHSGHLSKDFGRDSALGAGTRAEESGDTKIP